MNAFGLPRKTDPEKAAREQAIQDATKYAIEVPLKVMKLCYESMEVMKAMAETGNPNSASDAGVGAIAARSGVLGAFLNIKTNSASFKDKDFVYQVLSQGKEIEQKAILLEKEILEIVESKI